MKNETEIIKDLKELEEQLNSSSENPYLYKLSIAKERSYNANYGDTKECECGHSYYRHFDTYEDMAAVGCKYCGCYEFKPKL